MAYTEIYPAEKALVPLIECFWMHQPRSDEPILNQVMPDGCTDVIYQVHNEASLTGGAVRKKEPSPILVGTMTRPITTQLHPTQVYIGIRFRPGGMAAFLSNPLAMLTDQMMPVDPMQPTLGFPILEQLTSNASWPQRIQSLETYLLSLRQPTASLLSIQPVVDCILAEKGQTTLAQLSEVAGLSARQLERLFLKYVGISPKLLARIARFRHVKTILDNTPDDSLMGIAFDNGYTDHAHLTKEFTAFAGLTPSAYRER